MTTGPGVATPSRPATRTFCDIAHILESGEDTDARIRLVLICLGTVVTWDRCALLVSRSLDERDLVILPEPERDERERVYSALERLLVLLAEPTHLSATEGWREEAIPWPWRSHLAVPLIGLDRVLGVLAVGRDSPAAYSDDDLSMLALAASQLAAYVVALRAHEREQGEQSARDLLARAESEAAHARANALEELDRAKEQFIATASHDLKSPLASIRGYTQLLIRRIRGPAPELGQVGDWLAVIETQTRAIERLLDDLLDASRLQSAALQLRTAPCELGECLTTVLQRLSPQERKRVDVALGDSPLAGEWERKRVEQVLANLVGNALKYSPEDQQVTIVCERRPAEIEVAVSDRGMGILPEELPRLFERFQRTPQAYASGLTGTGLGLYICRGIIAAHGGRIWVESPGVDQGATFRFTLPITPNS